MKRATFFIGIERDRHGRQIHPDTRAASIQSIRRLAADTFGGYSMSMGAGGWINPKGELVEEGNIRLDIYTRESYAAASAFARTAGEWLNQDSILLDYNGVASFVSIPTTAHAGTRDVTIDQPMAA